MADEKRDIKFQLMLSETEMKAIDDWSFANRVRTRAEAIRRLSQRGLLYDKLIQAVLRGGDAAAAALKEEPYAMKHAIDFLDFVSSLGVDINQMHELEAAIAEASKSKKEPKE
jgi:hypothetical protein